MARVVALVPDLLFGSRCSRRSPPPGTRSTLVAGVDAAAQAAAGADALVVDLASGDVDPQALVAALPRPRAARCSPAYAHVEPDARERALAAGIDVVVPRSRLNREARGAAGGAR